MSEKNTGETSRSKNLATDSLGFELKVHFEVGDFATAGCHLAYEDLQGVVPADCEHRIQMQQGLDVLEAADVAAHEVYHLFYSIDHLITVEEETEVEVFGQLVKHLLEFYLQGTQAAAEESPADLSVPATTLDSWWNKILANGPEAIGWDTRKLLEVADEIRALRHDAVFPLPTPTLYVDQVRAAVTANCRTADRNAVLGELAKQLPREQRHLLIGGKT